MVSASGGCLSCGLIVRIAERSGLSFWEGCEDSERVVRVVCDFHDPNHDSIFVTLHFPQHLAHHDGLQKHEIRLELYIHQSQKVPWPGMRQASDISKGPRSTQGRRLMREWFEICRREHPECKLLGKSRGLPTRILDVGSVDSVGQPQPKLVSLKGKRAPYLALSHCWGNPDETQLPQTTSFNIESRIKGIPMAQLPPTFQDAVILSRKLKVQYLWIDSLCIIQNDKDDWGSESLQMASIYKNARLVISAAGAPNCNAGLFSTRTPPDVYNIAKNNGSRSAVYVRHETDHKDFTHRKEDSRTKSRNPLFTRAWAFQERLAARRVLHFCSDELVRECNSGIRCECGGLQDTGPLESLKLGQLRLAASRELDQSLEHWEKVVEQFTRRKLTFNSDRLPALSSLAEQLSSISLDGYYAGIWGHSLLKGNGLGWRRLPEYTDYPVLGNCKSNEYYAPSWSWAAVDGQVEFGDLFAVSQTATIQRARRAFKDWMPRDVEILNVGYTPANPQFPFASPATGHVTLCGVVTPTESDDWLSLEGSQDQGKEHDTIFFPDRFDSISLAAQKTSRYLLVKSYISSTRVTHGDARQMFLDKDLSLVEVAFVLSRSATVPGAYERLGLAVSRTRLPEIEYRERTTRLLAESKFPEFEDYVPSPSNERTNFVSSQRSIVTIV